LALGQADIGLAEHDRIQKERAKAASGKAAKPVDPLKKKGLFDMLVMLHATGYKTGDGTDASETTPLKELKAIARREGTVEKWEKLDDATKAGANRYAATIKVRIAEAKEAERKAEEKKRRKAKEPGMMEMMQEKFKETPWWERDGWTKEDEEDSLRRLRALPVWDTLGPEKMDQMMERIRGNPKILDTLEGEYKMRDQQQLLQQMQGQEMNTADIMDQAAAMGMQMHLHTFDNDK